MKKFFKEFKDFITRGNVLDMAVGVIVGGAFTAIVTALTKQILQPVINWLIALIAGGNSGLESAVTVLVPAYTETGVLDLAASIYIDWGAFITAIINFILVAFILFCIIKIINTVRAGGKKLADKQRKAIEKKLKKGEITAEEAAQAVAETAPVEEVPQVAAVTTEALLMEIRDLLKAQQAQAPAQEKPEEK